MGLQHLASCCSSSPGHASRALHACNPDPACLHPAATLASRANTSHVCPLLLVAGAAAVTVASTSSLGLHFPATDDPLLPVPDHQHSIPPPTHAPAIPVVSGACHTHPLLSCQAPLLCQCGGALTGTQTRVPHALRGTHALNSCHACLVPFLLQRLSSNDAPDDVLALAVVSGTQHL